MTDIDMKFLPNSRKMMKRRIPKRFRLKKLHHPPTNLVVFQLEKDSDTNSSSIDTSSLDLSSQKMKKYAKYVE